MAFVKFPLLLVMALILFSGGRVIPFLLIAFGLWMLLGVARQSARYEPRPTVSSDELDDLRNDVAVSLLDLDADDRLNTNPDARARYRSAGRHYTTASRAVDRGVRRRDRDVVARTLYQARYELEAAAAELEGRPVPEPPEMRRRSTETVMMTQRPQTRRRHRYACYW